MLRRRRLQCGLWLGPASLAVRSSPSTHLLHSVDLRPQAVGFCFLLTSARAVMLELVAVHSLFAVSPFPVDTRKRRSLSLSESGTSKPPVLIGAHPGLSWHGVPQLSL